MKRFAGLIVLASLALPSHAQASADHLSCAPWKARWAAVSAGSDLAAIDDVIGKIPGLCPNLKSEAATGRAGAAKRVEQERATRAAAAEKERLSREAAVRAADPCIQARSDWSYARNGSEGTLQAYVDGLPPACGMWRSQAQEKLAALHTAREQEEERQRLVASAEQQKREDAARIVELTAAAKATGIEARWEIFREGKECRPDLRGGLRITIEAGYLIERWETGETFRNPITRVVGSAVYYMDPEDKIDKGRNFDVFLPIAVNFRGDKQHTIHRC